MATNSKPAMAGRPYLWSPMPTEQTLAHRSPPHAVRPPAAHASAVAINTYLRMVILSPP